MGLSYLLFALKPTFPLKHLRPDLFFPLQCFLIAMDTAHEFLRDEGRAFIKLYVSAIQVLTPMQAALLLTSCAPLVAHLPDICCMLSSGNSRNQPAIATEGQGFSIADITLLNKFIE
jgi:hypothetical protein